MVRYLNNTFIMFMNYRKEMTPCVTSKFTGVRMKDIGLLLSNRILLLCIFLSYIRIPQFRFYRENFLPCLCLNSRTLSYKFYKFYYVSFVTICADLLKTIYILYIYFILKLRLYIYNTFGFAFHLLLIFIFNQ